MFKSSKKKVTVPTERGVYAFTKHRRGDFLLFVKNNGEEIYDFMQLPDLYKFSLTKNEFVEGVNTGLLDFVEQIPEGVYSVAVANIKTLEKSA